jgi:hypothetical protein
MVTVKILNKEYELPEGWHEVNLEKFEKIILKNKVIDEYKSQILFGLEIFAILTDAEINDLKNLTRESFEILSNEISWMTQTPKGIEKGEFIINNEVWKPIKDLNKLTMGDNISLELMISESDESNLILNILPILIRKVKIIKENGIEIEELQAFDSNKYSDTKELFSKSIYITDVINFKDFFLNGVKESSGTTKATSVSAARKKARKNHQVDNSI